MLLQFGHFYKDVSGHVYGPLFSDYDGAMYCSGNNSWRKNGKSTNCRDMDLVSEVFVFDHPPGLNQIKPDGTLEPVISMRMQIAIAAMQGMLANPAGVGDFEVIAIDAFLMADALIEQEGK